MRLARVIGTVEATVKDASLTGRTLLLLDLIDGAGEVTAPSVVAVDACGAGVGDQVLTTFDDAARMPAKAAGAATDAAVVAIIDRVTVAK
ncbi:MAG: EutN/CcmL family microcompartment protein [Pseudomonadota bacterium]